MLNKYRIYALCKYYDDPFVLCCTGSFGTFVSGGVAGMCLWTSIFPTDVIKSRIQVTGSKLPLWRIALTIYKNEGTYCMSSLVTRFHR